MVMLGQSPKGKIQNGGDIMPKYMCWGCGEEQDISSTPTERIYCEECDVQHKEKYKNIVNEYARLKTLIMCEQAIRTMEKAGTHMFEYLDAAYAVFNKAKANTKTFYSSHEIIMAIILESKGYGYYPNYSIGKYRVDFYIPELKVCVEVDGHLHKGRELYDSNRDIDIRNSLGAEWEVIRIPTKYLEKNPPAAIDAITVLYEEKQRLRNENHGILPDNFSLRERRHYPEILGYKKQRVRK